MNQTKTFLACLLMALPILLQASLKPVRLTCEYLSNPTAVDITNPRLSWINETDGKERGVYQTARQIRVASSKENLLAAKADLWDSGKITSAESLNIPYAGKPLASRQDCWWQVRVWDQKEIASEWSQPACWGVGFLSQDEWKATWIGVPWQGEEAVPRLRGPKNKASAGFRMYAPEKLPPPAPLLRKSFILDREPVKARAYVTGLGFFEFYVNGEKVSDDVLVPNLTLYGKREKMGDIGVYLTKQREYRVMYLAYDILPYLRKGENVAGAMLGNGFYDPANYWTEGYGSPRFLGQIHLTYSDGSEEVIVSDQSWKVAKGPIILDNVYDGEHYDAREEKPGWAAPGYQDNLWRTAVIRKAPDGKLVAHLSPTDRVMERLAPKKIERLSEGHYRVDFGEEISGWLHLMNLNGEAGHRIDIRYICESPIGDNSYTLKGEKNESYAARFTWFVFREVEITNWPGELKAADLWAEAVYTNVETTGKFECSNPLFNQIDKAWWRSQTDNMHGGIASDCPHRERSAYTGDGQVACVTVMHHFDARAFYSKWIRDIWGNQNPDNGYVPNGAPWQPGCGGGVAWGAAISIMPWEFFLHYGDTAILRDNFEAMEGYIRYMQTWTDDRGIMHSQAPSREKPNRWMNLGEWVAPGQLPPDPMVHTFFLWRCSDLTAQAAEALGKQAEALKYGALAGKTWKAFMDAFYDPVKGSYGPYGGNIFALKMGVPFDRKERVLAALKEEIKANDGHLDTGIFGTQFFFEVLAENGLDDLAYAALNKKTQPGYGWWLEQGATTTWEQWDGTNSRNHPMFGGGLTYLYRKLAGLQADPAQPGYRHIIVRPQPVGDLTFVSYANRTPYGDASVRWEKSGEKFSMSVIVPAGSTATVFVPTPDPSLVRESGKKTTRAKGVKFLEMKEGYALYSVSSGNYRFETALR